MNFLTKNLGWLLLLAFFVFMLFIISSNNNTIDQASLSGASIPSSSTGVSEKLDDLVDMLEGTGSINGDDSLIDEEGQDDMKGENERVGFFDFLKRKDNSLQQEDEENIRNKAEGNDENRDTSEENNETSEQSDTEGGILSRLFGDDEKAGEDDTIKITKEYEEGIQKGEDNLVKDNNDASNIATDYTYAPEVNSVQYQNLPGVNLETAIGKKYKIGVNTLKLNNKYFTKTLGYLYFGESVEQLSEENAYGCFEVRVEKNGKIGYVCKKWLTDKDVQQEMPKNLTQDDNSKEIAQEANDMVSFPESNIGDQIVIDEGFIVIDEVPLERGDIVDQLVKTDAQGCFQALVTKSYIIPAQGRIMTVCHADIK